MKARTLSFFIDTWLLPEVMGVIDDEIVRAYQSHPNLVSLIVVRSERNPRQLLAVSVWDDDAEDAPGFIEDFRRRLREVAGTAPAADHHDVLRFVLGQSAP